MTLVTGSTDIAFFLINGKSVGCLASMHGGVGMVLDMKTTAELGISVAIGQHYHYFMKSILI